MRVLMLHQETPDPNKGEQGAGGAEVIVRDIIDGLRARGHDVTWMQRREQWALLDGEWDVAHCVTIPHYIGMDAAEHLMSRGVPVVWTLMDYWPFCGPRMLLSSGTSGQGCPAVTGACDVSCGGQRAPAHWLDVMNRGYVVSMNAHSVPIYNRNGLRISDVIHPGVNPTVWCPAGPRDIDVATSAGYAETPEAVRQCMPWKGFDVLAAAIKWAPYSVAVCAGLPRAKLAGVLRRAKVYVFPSLYEETFGMALCEARASGCVCIASAVAGARAQITDGVDGILVPPGDPKALREAIDRVLGDYERYEPLGREARARVVAHDTISHMIDRYERAYASAQGGLCAA